MAENKVNFGLSNLHYAIITEGENGAITYGTPVRLPGAVEMQLEVNGETSTFYADNIAYYVTSVNNGYNGTLTIADLPASFRSTVLGETLDETSGILTETITAHPKEVALLFEFDGDQRETLHCLYRCTITRPNLGGATKTETTEPQTQELTFVASPRPDGVLKRSTTGTTSDEIRNAWYTKVYEPNPAG